MQQDAFLELRPLLFSIAYRMTGTRADAEDVLQEAYLRWQSVDGVQSPKAFLTTVVSRLSLDALKAAHRKREVYAGPWLPEPLVEPPQEPAELADSLSFAFLHLLEALPAQERVAFLMRDVFDAAYSDVAQTLETSEGNARQLVSRAREHLRARRPKNTVNPEMRERLFREFMRACAEGDSSALVALLKQDAILYTDGGGKVNAALNPILGAERIVRFVLGVRNKGLGRFGGFPVVVNGGPGAVVTLNGVPHTIVTVEMDEELIQTIYYVLNPEKIKLSLM